MLNKKITILLCLIIACLIGINLYFMNESTKPMYKILIGTPINNEVTSFGEVIKSKEDASTIELAVMTAISVEKPKTSNHLPDATILIDDWNLGIAYIDMDIWFDEDKVIFAVGEDYKEIVGATVKDVKEIIAKYQPKK